MRKADVPESLVVYMRISKVQNYDKNYLASSIISVVFVMTYQATYLRCLHLTGQPR
jgi:hypothetical protein